MSINVVIKKEMEKSGGKVRIVKIPKEKRGTLENLAKLDQEIKTQVDANKAMNERAWIYANNK